jgi:hypothetical protein
MDNVQKHNICTKRIVFMPPRSLNQKMHLCTSKSFVIRKVCFARPWANLLLLAGYYTGFKMNVECGWLVTLNCGKYRWITIQMEGLNMNLVGGTKLKFSKLHISLFMSSCKNWTHFARTSGAEVSTCYFPMHKQGYSFPHFRSGTTSTYKSCTHQSSTHHYLNTHIYIRPGLTHINIQVWELNFGCPATVYSTLVFGKHIFAY